VFRQKERFDCLVKPDFQKIIRNKLISVTKNIFKNNLK